jgi:hypothetical protein
MRNRDERQWRTSTEDYPCGAHESAAIWIGCERQASVQDSEKSPGLLLADLAVSLPTTQSAIVFYTP